MSETWGVELHIVVALGDYEEPKEIIASGRDADILTSIIRENTAKGVKCALFKIADINSFVSQSGKRSDFFGRDPSRSFFGRDNSRGFFGR